MKISLPTSPISLRKLGLALAIVGVGILIGLAGWLYSQDSNPTHWLPLLTNPDRAGQSEITKLVETVGKIAVLPSDEIPNVATVVDKQTLMSQPFFALAENGDKVLIYSKAERAYIYRPSTHQMVNVGPLIIEATQP